MAVYRLEAGEGSGSLETDITRTVTLEDTAYDLRFRWNTRDESWTFICSLSGGDPIFRTKAQTNRLLNDLYKHRDNCPQGDFIILDMAGVNGRVDFENFTYTGRYRLFYNESEDSDE